MDIREHGTSVDFWIKAKIKLVDSIFQSLEIKNAKILDIGCGTGEDLEMLNRYGTVYITDTEKRTLEMIPKDLYAAKRLGTAEDIDFPSNMFDVVVAFDVIEHIKDDKAAVKEIGRVLRNGGYFIFTVPAFQSFYSAHDKALGHYRRYSKAMLLALLNDFEIRRLSYWNSSLFLPLAAFRMLRRGKDTADTSMNLPAAVNSALYHVLRAENIAAKLGVPMPAGLSLYGVCRKT